MGEVRLSTANRAPSLRTLISISRAARGIRPCRIERPLRQAAERLGVGVADGAARLHQLGQAIRRQGGRGWMLSANADDRPEAIVK